MFKPRRSGYAALWNNHEESDTEMMAGPAMTYEQAEDVQRTFCEELHQQYVAAHPDLKVGFALETRGRIL